jgi:hypothetical protein
LATSPRIGVTTNLAHRAAVPSAIIKNCARSADTGVMSLDSVDEDSAASLGLHESANR